MEKIDFAEPTSFWEFKGQGEYTDNKLLMATPIPMAVTVVSYLWFVLKFGPEFMKNRKPIDLANILVAYNVVQVVLSYCICHLGFQYLFEYGLWSSTCYSNMENVKNQISDGSHLYFLAKVVELLDTVFFVLRKKQRQVSFLHVYHHTLMVIATWTAVKYNMTDSVVLLGTTNSLVHIVMYTYYGLSVYPALTKYLWWKKYITIMQLIQFTFLIAHIIVSHMVSECKPAYALLFCVCSNAVIFMYLFGDFYIKSYTKKTESAASVENVKISSRSDRKTA